jgi:hypothetical protein
MRKRVATRLMTVSLIAVLVGGCAAPDPVQAPAQDRQADQLQPPEQVQTAEPGEATERQKREQYQKRAAAEKKRIAAEKERVAQHLQRDLAPVCTSAGLTPGSDAHSRCVDSLYRRELERIAESARK